MSSHNFRVAPFLQSMNNKAVICTYDLSVDQFNMGQPIVNNKNATDNW